MANNNNTKILLGIKDPNIELKNHDFEEEFYFNVQAFRTFSNKALPVSKAFIKVLTVTGTLVNVPKACLHYGYCNNGFEAMIANGSYNTVILIGQYNLQATYLKLSKQRYLCKHCRKTTVVQTHLTQPHCTISSPLKVMLLQELCKTKAMTDIAETWNVSTHTVIRQLKAYTHSYNKRPKSLPKHLAIDEFKSVKSATASISCILMDNHRHLVIDVLENRTQACLYQYLMRFTRKERSKVKTITMDMNGHLKIFYRRFFLKLRLSLIDFILYSSLRGRLINIVLRVMNRFKTKNKPLYNKYKRYWKLLLKASDKLKFEMYKRYGLFKNSSIKKELWNFY